MKHFRRLLLLMLLTAALLPCGLAPALAGPNGASVVAGSATVGGQGSANVVVNQTSQRAIINWNTFNIGAGQSTTINMPGASSTELDRVTGGQGPSQIFGSLTSNGQVFLVNPDGILFGKGARVNTGSFLATTHDIVNADFMAGRYNFFGLGNPAASVVNQGMITARTGGFAALVAPGVRNTGVITANLGTVSLASGNAFTLDFYGDNLIKLGLNDSIASQVIDVSTGKPLSSLVSNEGTLKANGGRVELTAVAARTVVDSVINNTGVIEADTIGTHNGMIVLGAATAASKPAGAPAQTVKVSGTLSASGKRKGTKGGTIVMTGEKVQLAGATIDASGRAGGGAVLVGGDWGGGHPNTSLVSNPSAYLEPFAVPNASTVSVDAATTIDASAKESGNGGKVIVWSNEATTFYGTIVAQGGTLSGNGGFVETSSRGQLSFSGTVEAGAAHGANGTLLLDPQDVTIGTSGTWIVTPSALTAALTSNNVIVGTDASLAGNGDLTIAQGFSWSGPNTLILGAYRNIVFGAGVVVSNTGSGSLNLGAGLDYPSGAPWFGTGTGTIIFSGPNQIDFSKSTGFVTFGYNPRGGYASPTDFSGNVVTNPAVSNQFTAFMWVNNVNNLQNINQNLSGNYLLANSINASATASWNGGAGFIPIGTASTPFNGLFIGSPFASPTTATIQNLTINSSLGEAGLFGAIGPNGYVEGLTLANVSVKGTNLVGTVAGLNDGFIYGVSATGSASGPATVGGLVGYNHGFIENANASVTVSGGTTGLGGLVGGLVGKNDSYIGNSAAAGAVIGASGSFVGGLVGENTGFAIGPTSYFGLVTTSYASGSVTGTGLNAAGGLVGSNDALGTIQFSYATGAVTAAAGWAGGLAGITYGSIYQAYATGAVRGGAVLGGLVGSDFAIPIPSIMNSYWDMESTGIGIHNGVGNVVDAPGVTGLTTNQLTSGLPTGFDPSWWGSNSSINNGYPYLLWTQAPPAAFSAATFSPSINPPSSVVNQALNYSATFGQTVEKQIGGWLTIGESELQKSKQVIGPLLSDITKLLSSPGMATQSSPSNVSTNSVVQFSVVGPIVEPYWNKNANPPAGPAGSVRETLTLNIGSNHKITLQSLSNGADQGKPYGVGANGFPAEAFQCSALIVRYAIKLGITGLLSDYSNVLAGKDVAKQLAKVSNGKFKYFANGSTEAPTIGAVISIGASGADTAGHVGIVQSKTPPNAQGAFTVTLFDQNVRGGWLQVTFTKNGNSYKGSTTELIPGSTAPVVGWANPVGF